MNPEQQWHQSAERFRKTLAEPEPDSPIPGFSTRVVALANLDGGNDLLSRLRFWSLGTAAASALALTLLVTLQKPHNQFVPVPELKLPTPNNS